MENSKNRKLVLGDKNCHLVGLRVFEKCSREIYWRPGLNGNNQGNECRVRIILQNLK